MKSKLLLLLLQLLVFIYYSSSFAFASRSLALSNFQGKVVLRKAKLKVRSKSKASNRKQILRGLDSDSETVQVFPDEIAPQEEHFESYDGDSKIIRIDPKSTYSYKAKLKKEQLPLFHHPRGVYYKDELPYYGPQITYNSIPDPEEEENQYLTPITIAHPTLTGMKSKEELEAELNELNMELTHLLLFSDEPKYLNKDTANYTVYNKFPLPYYDPTEDETINRIKELKSKIIDIKVLLHMPPEVHYDIVVQNNTFPVFPDDIVTHFNESFISYRNNTHDHESDVINGNLTKVHEVYKVRKAHSFNHQLLADRSINIINKFKTNSEGTHSDGRNMGGVNNNEQSFSSGTSFQNGQSSFQSTHTSSLYDNSSGTSLNGNQGHKGENSSTKLNHSSRENESLVDIKKNLRSETASTTSTKSGEKKSKESDEMDNDDDLNDLDDLLV